MTVNGKGGDSVADVMGRYHEHGYDELDTCIDTGSANSTVCVVC